MIINVQENISTVNGSNRFSFTTENSSFLSPRWRGERKGRIYIMMSEKGFNF